MALEKLKIEVETAPGVYGRSFSVLFNPSQITLDKSVNWKSEGIAERNASKAEFTHGNPYTLALDLFFDTYEEGTDVRVHTQRVANLLMVKGTLKQPPRCRLIWGCHNFNGYLWVLERLSQRFTLFLPNGMPVRATLGCSFKQSQSADEEKTERDLLDVARVHTVEPGDTLAGIAARTYKNPSLWRLIAEANGILNPRLLKAGIKLLIPARPSGLPSKKNSGEDEGTEGSAGYTVTIDGTPLVAQQVEVVSIMAHRDDTAPGVFEMQLKNRSNEDQVIFSDDPRFAVGNKVEIGLGKTPQRVMAGEITSLELDFRSGEEMLMVRGHDRGHRLLRGRKTRTFVDTTDSEIVSKVAEEASLEARVEATGVKLPYVQQHNQTDWEFLRQRARRLGFELLMDDDVLKFRPHQEKGSAVLTLGRNKELIEFRPCLSTIGLASDVAVRGWNPKDKEAIIAAKEPAGGGAAMGGSKGGLAAARSAFGAAEGSLVDQPVFSQAEAELVASGRLSEMALAYVTGDGVAVGDSRLKAGTFVEIDGFGTCFSGLYYLSSVCHTYSSRRGYRSTFTVRRNAT